MGVCYTVQLYGVTSFWRDNIIIYRYPPKSKRRDARCTRVSTAVRDTYRTTGTWPPGTESTTAHGVVFVDVPRGYLLDAPAVYCESIPEHVDFVRRNASARLSDDAFTSIDGRPSAVLQFCFSRKSFKCIDWRIACPTRRKQEITESGYSRLRWIFRVLATISLAEWTTTLTRPPPK